MGPCTDADAEPFWLPILGSLYEDETSPLYSEDGAPFASTTGLSTNALCMKPSDFEAGSSPLPFYLEIIDGDAGEFAPNYFGDMSALWILVAGFFVFLMQAGFAMLEAGSVSTKNTINILFKNLLDVCLAAISFWLVGYGIAYGESAGGFIGTGPFGLKPETDSNSSFEGFFFQMVFAATASTIVSGSVAERTKFTAYFVYSIIITGFIYPVVVHWGWASGDEGGFLSAFSGNGVTFLASEEEPMNGFIDFAGSGIVHMVGGFAGLVGAIVVGPRKGRFNEDGSVNPMQGHSFVLASLGVIILWFGWYGFNPGSTLCAGECMFLAGQVATTTTIAAAAATVTGTFVTKYLSGTWDLAVGLNSVIAGLVSITAPCSVVSPASSMAIGCVGALVYIGSAKLLLKLKIDDPLEASCLHGFCGIWGVLAVGIFATDERVAAAYGTDNDAVSSGQQMLVQTVGMLCILGWTLATSLVTFLGIKFTIGMRVDAETEEKGLDASEHGAQAYLGFD